MNIKLEPHVCRHTCGDQNKNSLRQTKKYLSYNVKKYIGQNGIIRLYAGDEKATAYHKHWHWHEAKL